MNKIIITGDLIRVDNRGNPSQISNIKWFYHLVNWQISSILNSCKLNILLPGQPSGRSFSENFFSKCGLENSEASWVKIYNQKEVPPSAFAYFEETFEGAFIIGYELPEVFLHLFDKLGIKYLDFALHPIRYLDDIFFGVRTNCSEVFQRLLAFALPSDVYFIYAGIHRGTLAKTPRLDLEKDSCVFVGQTEIDRSLLRNGRLLSVFDFEAELRFLESRYSKIYYKRHPYAANNNGIFDIISDSRKIQNIDENIYRLMASEEIDKLFSISSSVCFESKFFGKDAEAFLPQSVDMYNFDTENPSPNSYVPLMDDFLYPKFWAEVLSPHFQTCCYSSFRIPLKTSRLRTSLGCFWGYNFLDAEILFNELVPKIRALPPRPNNSPFIDFLKKIFFRV